MKSKRILHTRTYASDEMGDDIKINNNKRILNGSIYALFRTEHPMEEDTVTVYGILVLSSGRDGMIEGDVISDISCDLKEAEGIFEDLCAGMISPRCFNDFIECALDRDAECSL